MAIKLLISDLDGTLLGADSRIIHQTANALTGHIGQGYGCW